MKDKSDEEDEQLLVFKKIKMIAARIRKCCCVNLPLHHKSGDEEVERISFFIKAILLCKVIN